MSGCATWLVHTCDMTHSYLRHDSFIRATWLIHTCDMTHSYVQHDSFTGFTCGARANSRSEGSWRNIFGRHHRCQMNESQTLWVTNCVTRETFLGVVTNSRRISHELYDSWYTSLQKDLLASSQVPDEWVTNLRSHELNDSRNICRCCDTLSMNESRTLSVTHYTSHELLWLIVRLYDLRIICWRHHRCQMNESRTVGVTRYYEFLTRYEPRMIWRARNLWASSRVSDEWMSHERYESRTECESSTLWRARCLWVSS